MYKILKKVDLTNDTVLFDVLAPRIAESALPGQFLIVKMDEKGERIPLTVSDNDAKAGTVTIVFKVVGNSTQCWRLLLRCGRSARSPVGTCSYTER